jgi:hypothetical protein
MDKQAKRIHNDLLKKLYGNVPESSRLSTAIDVSLKSPLRLYGKKSILDKSKTD